MREQYKVQMAKIFKQTLELCTLHTLCTACVKGAVSGPPRTTVHVMYVILGILAASIQNITHYKFKSEVRMQSKNAIAIDVMAGMRSMQKRLWVLFGTQVLDAC